MQGFIESFWLIWKKYKIEICLIISSLIIALISILVFFLNQQPATTDEVLLEPVKTETIKTSNIFVDLSGAVERADVYEVTSGARLKDVLIQAGGLSADADRGFFARSFNLARKLKDQEKIYIPNQEEIQSELIQINQPALTNYDSNTLAASSEKISLNNATMDQLDTLPGIGKITAQKIIQNRPYQSLEDLLNKKIVGKNLYERIKESIQL